MCAAHAMDAPIFELVNLVGSFEGERSNLDRYPGIFTVRMKKCLPVNRAATRL